MYQSTCLVSTQNLRKQALVFWQHPLLVLVPGVGQLQQQQGELLSPDEPCISLSTMMGFCQVPCAVRV